jgi:hypothetical protein
MSRGEEKGRRWQISLTGVMLFTTGIAVSLAFVCSSDFRKVEIDDVAGSFIFGGTIVGGLSHFLFGTNEAAAKGFVVGGVLGIVSGTVLFGIISGAAAYGT